MKIKITFLVAIIMTSLAVLLHKNWTPHQQISQNRLTTCKKTLGHAVQNLVWQSSPCFFIAHATGAIDGFVYTNSREALMQSIQNGFRLIEIDLQETSDGHLVGVHSWEEFKQKAGFPNEQLNDKPLSLEDFKKQKLHDRYTPLTAAAIARIFEAHPELILVTDKSNNFELILKSFPFPERMIVEVFSEDAFQKAQQIGIQRPAFNVTDEKDFKFVNNNRVHFVTADFGLIKRLKNQFQKLMNDGVQILAYTVDDEQEFEKHLGLTTAAFYTDYWDVSAGTSGCPNNC